MAARLFPLAVAIVQLLPYASALGMLVQQLMGGAK